MLGQIASYLQEEYDAKDEYETRGKYDGEQDKHEIDAELQVDVVRIDRAVDDVGFFVRHERVHEHVAHVETQREQDEANDEALVEAQREEFGAYERKVEHDEALHGQDEQRVDRYGAEHVAQVGHELAAQKALVDEIELARVLAKQVNPGAKREVDIVKREHEQIGHREEEKVDGELLLGFLVEKLAQKQTQRHRVAVQAERCDGRDEHDVEPFRDRVERVDVIGNFGRRVGYNSCRAA